jgi:hypothetical protein
MDDYVTIQNFIKTAFTYQVKVNKKAWYNTTPRLIPNHHDLI